MPDNSMNAQVCGVFLDRLLGVHNNTRQIYALKKVFLYATY